ncbi:MAG: hypothetical protein DMG57_35055 [Acidobacteria bacterium]|nr:MAG: hypothetical protein DMG57_35055 [Acidobacteriota bacterium]
MTATTLSEDNKSVALDWVKLPWLGGRQVKTRLERNVGSGESRIFDSDAHRTTEESACPTSAQARMPTLLETRLVPKPFPIEFEAIGEGHAELLK